MTDRSSSATPEGSVERRVLDFARSEVFERTFRDGMLLVEETAGYLDGPGRAASKKLDRLAALTYASESMRLTTRLMQIASWLLVQRALREGEMSLAEAGSQKYRFTRRDRPEIQQGVGLELLPEALVLLMTRCDTLYERVRRLDDGMYEAEMQAENAVSSHMARLRAAFDH
jgi:regulator of CtrA degradation